MSKEERHRSLPARARLLMTRRRLDISDAASVIRATRAVGARLRADYLPRAQSFRRQ